MPASTRTPLTSTPAWSPGEPRPPVSDPSVELRRGGDEDDDDDDGDGDSDDDDNDGDDGDDDWLHYVNDDEMMTM